MANILIIEDDNLSASITLFTLQKQGHEVLHAEDGQIGVKMAEEITPDLIISDISMPIMDGYSTLEFIRSNRKTARTPFILLTAKDDKPSWRKGMALGADDFLTKPFTPNELLAAVEQQLKKKTSIDSDQEKAIRSSLEQERKIFMSGPVSIFKIDSADNYKIDFISENISQWGYNAEKLTQNKQSYLEIMPLEDQEQVKISFSKAREQRKLNFEIEHRIQLPDHTYCWVHGFIKSVADDGDHTSPFHGYIVDITKRKLLEQELLNLRQREKGKLNKLLDTYKLSEESQDYPSSFNIIDTCSLNYIKILHEADLHATSNIPILITGESGTGKDQLAKAIHKSSPVAKQPFYHISMATFPEAMAEIEKAYKNYLELPESFIENTPSVQGTIFIDEIGHLPIEHQGKLLRILQDNELNNTNYFNPLKRPTNRIIAATSMDPEQLMQKGILRKDFYYRLRGAWLHIPALRERKEDIPLLLKKFFGEIGGAFNDNSIEPKTKKLLMSYPFPGNIRELRSVAHYAINLSQGEPINVKHLPASIKNFSKKQSAVEQNTFDTSMPSLYEVEKEHILKAYQASGRNKVKAAKLLDISLSTLRRKLDQYGV